MTEIWKDIEGLEGKYQVSNLGNVRSISRDCNCKGDVFSYKRHHRGKLLKLNVKENGYMEANLGKNGCYLVHRLVALSFVPGYFEGAQVNHIDENKQNNRYDNLEWVTPSQNINHGNCIKKIKEKQIGVPVAQYTLDGVFVTSYSSMHEAAKAVNANVSNLCNALDSHYSVRGFRFKRILPTHIDPNPDTVSDHQPDSVSDHQPDSVSASRPNSDIC